MVLGYDVTCAVPKSVSLLWAFGDAALRRDVAAALDAGVDAVLGYLERHGAADVVAGRDRAAAGLAVASYLHEVSRSDEAHLHVHNIVVNTVAVPADDERAVVHGVHRRRAHGPRHRERGPPGRGAAATGWRSAPRSSPGG